MLKIFSLVAISLCTCIPPAVSQSVMGARELGIGQAVTVLPESEWSVFANPAMLSTKHSSVSFFGIRYYGLSEVTDAAVSLQYPVSVGVVAAGLHRYGFDLFSRNRIRLAYKNEFAGFYYGFALNYSHISQGGGYGSAGALGVDVGIATSLFDRVWLGGRSTNVNQPQFGGIEDLPREFSIGMAFILSDFLLLSTDIVKDVRFPVSYRGGIEVEPIRGIVGRAGFTAEPTTYSLGFGYAAKRLKVNVAAQNHQALGISPGFDFTVLW